MYTNPQNAKTYYFNKIKGFYDDFQLSSMMDLD